MDIDLGVMPEELGAARPIVLAATRYRQGGRIQFHVAIPVWQLTQIVVNRPDPNRPLEGNRKVDARRADKFADYLLSEERWISPAIIVRAPRNELTFTSKQDFADETAWGVLEIRLDLLSEIVVLDGQHRTLGIFLALEKINNQISKQRALIDELRDQGIEGSEIARQQKLLDKFMANRKRLSHEHISIDIAEISQTEAGQLFGDINNNAKGVNADLTTVLDQRVVVNRISFSLIESHPLLKDRVEIGTRARFGAKNENLMGAKGVADIVRAVFVGTGRVGARVEDELAKDVVGSTAKVERFLDLLVAAFEDLEAVEEGELTPLALRDESLLGSVTMLRALAAAYHDLTDPASGRPMNAAQVEDYFRKLSPLMNEAPVRESSRWMATGAFSLGAMAPSARSQDFSALVKALVAWGRNGIPST